MKFSGFKYVVVFLFLLIGSAPIFSAITFHKADWTKSVSFPSKSIQTKSFESQDLEFHHFVNANNKDVFFVEISETELEESKISKQNRGDRFLLKYFYANNRDCSISISYDERCYFPPLYGATSRLLVLFQVFRI
jgi:hypothetical protein